MVLDFVVVLALFAFAWLGAHRGAGESGIRLAGLGFSYGGAFLAGKLAGSALANALAVPSWAGLAGAGAIGFAAAQALVELAARRARAAGGPELPDSSRVVGSLFGIARGGLLLLPLLWLASFTESVRVQNPAAPLPNFSGARAAGIGQVVATAAADRIAASGDGTTRITAKLIAQPGASIAALSAIASDTRIRMLQADRGFWDDLESGNVEGALARPSFAELARDGELRGRLADLGVVASTSAVDAQQFHDEVASVVAELGPRLRRIKADPAFQDLLADEALRARVQAGDTVSLLTDPRIQQIVANASR